MFIIGYLIAMVTSFCIAYFLKVSLSFKTLILAMIMAIFAFFVVPDINSRIDALPYLFSLNNIRFILHNKGIAAAWHLIYAVKPTNTLTQTMSFSGTPVMGLIMLVFSLLPNPFFLAAIAFMDYFFVLKSIQLIVSHNNLPHKIYAYSYLIFMALFVYTNAVGGVRNNFVGTVLGYTYLKYFTDNRPIKSLATINVLVITLILMMIHPFTLLLFILFCLALFLKKHWEYWVADGILILHSSFQQIIFTLLTPLSAIPFFGGILDKSNQYLGDNATLFISSFANWVRDFARLIIMIATMIVVYKVAKNKVNPKYTLFVMFLICFSIGAIKDQVLFERCLLVLLPIMIPYITLLPLQIKQSFENRSNYLTYKFVFIIFISSFAIFCLIDNLRAGELYYTFLFNSSPLVNGF